jgi:hypothetical protein
MRVFFREKNTASGWTSARSIKLFCFNEKGVKKPVMPLRGVAAQRAIGMEDES